MGKAETWLLPRMRRKDGRRKEDKRVNRVMGKDLGLATCPHCGKEVEFLVHGNTAYIFCSDHNCWGGSRVSWGSADKPYIFIEKLKANWNKRVPEQNALVKAIEYLEEYRDTINKQIEQDKEDSYFYGCCIEALDEAIQKARVFVV